jgi:type I restriction-modification system DNA methylase subunit
MSRQSNDSFIAELEALGMLSANGELDADEELVDLYFVSDRAQVNNPSVRIALEQAADFEADAVFFRVFPKDAKRHPIPQIYIYHDTNICLNQNRYGEIQRRIWNSGTVPLAFISSAVDLKILNCRQAPEVQHGKFVLRPFAALEKLVAAERTFATRGISTGSLWDNPKFKNDFALDKTAYYKLLEFLKVYRDKLVKQQIASEPVVNRILVMAILIKYLADRRDSAGNQVFQEGFFWRFVKFKPLDNETNGLAEIFRERGGCVKLLDCLSEHFNGRIFELSANEKAELQTADLSAIADFLVGDKEPDGQMLFWPLYSFEYLPVELISNIYEEFLAKKDKTDTKGIVYTPPMLVDFLLDRCLPLTARALHWRILDPACGSGIFLVGVFKRLVQCWKLANNWKTPNYQDLQGILKTNIFGFDKEPEAVLVTAFSLCVALCDELEPLVIWNKLKFDDLREENLLAKDFFEIVESKKFENYFDLIIGNPPFDSEFGTNAAEKLDTKAFSLKERPAIPDNQVALLFLEQSFRLCQKEATLCLIQPAGPLLYNGTAQAFRKYLFDRFNIHTVLDFTALEGSLFKAKVAAAAIIGNKGSVVVERVLHIIFRRTRAVKEKLLFELDPYDFHWIPHNSVKQSKYVWKANLLGGGRLHQLLDRLISNAPTLGEYLEKKRDNDGWQFCEGYSVGCGNKLNKLPNRHELIQLSGNELKQRFALNRTPKVASWITGKPNILPEALTLNGIVGAIAECEHLFFEEPRELTQKIFQPPHVLIREVVCNGAIPAIFSNEEQVFSKQIIGIHAKRSDEDKLKKLAARLNDSKVFGFLAVVASSRILVSRATSILQEDILAFPYEEDKEESTLTNWESALIEDVLEYLIDFRLRGDGSRILDKISDSDLAKFGEMYCRILNQIYHEFRPLQPILFDPFICFPFCYGKVPEIEMPSKNEVTPYLEELLRRRIGSRLFVNRVLRLYEQNVIFMVKPNQKRYWLRSIAIRDADETLVDLLQQGY